MPPFHKTDLTFVLTHTVGTLIQQAPPTHSPLCLARAASHSGGQNVVVAIVVISTYYFTLVTVVLPINRFVRTTRLLSRCSDKLVAP